MIRENINSTFVVENFLQMSCVLHIFDHVKYQRGLHHSLFCKDTIGLSF